tara:strand:+ start:103943 stop:104176 length:234 start_codon:yes stop_codon:yes gene_type:complete
MIKLSSKELDFIKKNLNLDENLSNFISSCDGTIPEKFADEIREVCIEKYDYEGLDENYNPTQVGVELDNLIDKLLVK